MLQPQEMVTAVRAALVRRPEVKIHDSSIELTEHDGILVMRGEVQDIIARLLTSPPSRHSAWEKCGTNCA